MGAYGYINLSDVADISPVRDTSTCKRDYFSKCMLHSHLLCRLSRSKERREVLWMAKLFGWCIMSALWKQNNGPYILWPSPSIHLSYLLEIFLYWFNFRSTTKPSHGLIAWVWLGDSSDAISCHSSNRIPTFVFMHLLWPSEPTQWKSTPSWARLNDDVNLAWSSHNSQLVRIPCTMSCLHLLTYIYNASIFLLHLSY